MTEPISKQSQLNALENEIANDASLPLRSANLVFGEGNPDTKVLFIGEAPGLNEDQQKRPFVGRGGQLLNDMLTHIGWKREEVYITNIVKRRPPNNRDPEPSEIEAYKPYLTRQIKIISAPIIVPLGRFAMNYFLPNARIMRDQGKGFELNGRLIVPMLHPAAALRGNEVMALFKASFEKLPAVIKKWEEMRAARTAPAVQEEQQPMQEKLF